MGEVIPFTASDGKPVRLYRWLPAMAPLATIQIAHGMGEHAARYDPLGGLLAAQGYAVYANDHRGHGATAEPGAFGWMGPDGWNRVIADAHEIAAHVAAAHPGIPRVLLGHSMGAMLAQQYLTRHGAELDAAILSGSPGFNAWWPGLVSRTLARFERLRLGPEAESPLMQKALFGNANAEFDGPEATGFEWLSRDPDQVREYVDDPACGFVLRTGSLCDLFAGAQEAKRKQNVARIPGRLPMLILSGSADPVHANAANLERMLKRYRAHLTDIDYRLYPGGRHELFNDTNREEVFRDLLAWLRAKTSGQGRGP
jgi:alpha-beta hydrolase superfamily lysophospholipase